MKQNKRNVELSLLYVSADNRLVFLDDLLNGIDYLDPAEQNPGVFWGCSGGMEMLIDGYSVIFKSVDFHYLVKVVSFLLHGLYKIIERTSSWFDEGSANEVVLRTAGGDFLILSIFSEEVQISYLNKAGETRNEKRHDRYFDRVALNKQVFYDAAYLALSEYFQILRRIIDEFTDDATSRIMQAYFEVWQDIG